MCNKYQSERRTNLLGRINVHSHKKELLEHKKAKDTRALVS